MSWTIGEPPRASTALSMLPQWLPERLKNDARRLGELYTCQ